MIRFNAKGDFNNTKNFLIKLRDRDFYRNLHSLAAEGVAALSEATPKDTGLTADSWKYDIVKTANSVTITWSNTNFNKGVPIAMLIQYGHGTRNGGYVQGYDYINPAMKPIFDKIEEYVMKEVNAK